MFVAITNPTEARNVQMTGIGPSVLSQSRSARNKNSQSINFGSNLKKAKKLWF
jgi:hypothetical protein